MGVIFPLSGAGRVVLIVIAIALGCILWMMMKPEHWEWLFKRLKKEKPKEPKE
jgi:lauroyl/myristoyl acyltransferase